MVLCKPLRFNIIICRTEHCIVLLLLYLDDMVITGSDVINIQGVKDCFSKNFEMKDLGPMKYFLGIEVDSSSLVAIFVPSELYF